MASEHLQHFNVTMAYSLQVRIAAGRRGPPEQTERNKPGGGWPWGPISVGGNRGGEERPLSGLFTTSPAISSQSHPCAGPGPIYNRAKAAPHVYSVTLWTVGTRRTPLTRLPRGFEVATQAESGCGCDPSPRDKQKNSFSLARVPARRALVPVAIRASSPARALACALSPPLLLCLCWGATPAFKISPSSHDSTANSQ